MVIVRITGFEGDADGFEARDRVIASWMERVIALPEVRDAFIAAFLASLPLALVADTATILHTVEMKHLIEVEVLT